MKSSGMPDVSVDRLRRDFDKIFGVHNYTCELIRYADAQAGDFFGESGSGTISRTKIKISLQAQTTILLD
jgi:hypothetical protein